MQRTKFETELQVRPDDIDLFRHVHSSRYLDYLLAARFDQMERCYGLSMEEFLKQGLGWYVKTSHFEYKRALGIAERFVVRTWVEDIHNPDVEVRFEMLKQTTHRPACLGWCIFTLVNYESGKPVQIPDWIVEKYSI